MTSRKLLVSVAVAAVLLLGLVAGLAAGQAGAQEPEPSSNAPAESLSTSFTYQGQLIKDGAPVNGACDIRFTLYDAASGGSQVGPVLTMTAADITGGLFTSNLDFGYNAFNGDRRWLQVEARCPTATGEYVIVGDPQELTASPYALYAAWNWGLEGNAGTTPGTHYLGTSDNQALQLKVNGQRALLIQPNATSPNLIGGSSSNTVGAGYYGATIAGGGQAASTCGSGYSQPCWNRVSGSYGTIGGGQGNSASGALSTIGGGDTNTATAEGATAAGGRRNDATGVDAAVGGGYDNAASGTSSTVPGGAFNVAAGDFSFAAGRQAAANHDGSFVWADYSTEASFASAADNSFMVRASGGVTMAVGSGAWRIEPHATSPNLIGGYSGNTVSPGAHGAAIGGGGDSRQTCGLDGLQPCWNRASGTYSTIGGGVGNRAGCSSCSFATVAGGGSNEATDVDATVGGGLLNVASSAHCTVAGGSHNEAIVRGATVSGGYGNQARNSWSSVGGGYSNDASGPEATICGGSNNTADDYKTTVGGGYNNIAGGYGAVVPGGAENHAGGAFSFAAGYHAEAVHDGSFIWADSTGADIASTGANQFVVRAYGGAKIVRGQSTFASTNAALQVEQADTTGQAIYATSTGTLKDGAAAYLEATNTTGGIALWAKAQGNDTVMLLEQAANAGEFVKFYQTDPSNLRFKVTWDGVTYADGAYTTPAADFAELLPAEASVAAGDVLVIGPDGKLVRSSAPYAAAVAGVVSAQPGFLGGAGEGGAADGKVPLAIVGVVPVKVSAENGAIRPGDLLTTSATAGHAMRCEGVERCFGRTIGKALEGLNAGAGVIKVLVMLQ